MRVFPAESLLLWWLVTVDKRSWKGERHELLRLSAFRGFYGWMSDAASVSPNPSLFQRVGTGLDWVFGLVALIGLLAVCSVVPLLNFLSLGYLLHISGRVAQTGRIRDGFSGVRLASGIGSIALGAWLVLWPLRLAVELWHDAELIAPGSANARVWHLVVLVLAAVSFLHVLWAIIRGGKLRHFMWPQPLKFVRWLAQEAKWSELAARFNHYAGRLKLPYLFRLGLKGFGGAVMWLAVPVGLLLIASKAGAVLGPLFTFVGGVLLALVAIHLPFLQTRVALTGKVSSVLEWREVRVWFHHAPLAFWLALLVTLLLALPLYLLKIELTPRDLVWLPSLVFVIFIFPARILTGWAVSRALKRETPRHWLARWAARFATVPVALAYGLVVALTPYLSWNGARSLLEQHAFMVPAPLMAL